MFANCGHCGMAELTMVEIAPEGAACKKMAVCCRSCLAVLGVTDFYNAGAMIRAQESFMWMLSAKIDSLSVQIEHLAASILKLEQAQGARR